jgi:hypothetical protein
MSTCLADLRTKLRQMLVKPYLDIVGIANLNVLSRAALDLLLGRHFVWMLVFDVGVVMRAQGEVELLAVQFRAPRCGQLLA